MKAHIRLVAVTVSWALAAAEPGLAAVMVVPSAGRVAPVPIANGAILTPGGGISGSLMNLSGTLSISRGRPTLPTAPMVRPESIAIPPVAASASNPALSMDSAALPRASAATRAEEGVAVESMIPAGPAPLTKEARTGFRERLASLSRGIQGIVAHRSVAKQLGELARLFDSQGQVAASKPPLASGDVRSSRPTTALHPTPGRGVKTGESPAKAVQDSEAPIEVLAPPATAVPAPAEAHERRASSAHALRLTNAVVAVGTLGGTIVALFVSAPPLALGAAGSGLLILALTALDASWAIFELPYAGWVLRVVGTAAALVFVAGIIGIIVLPS